MILAAAAQEHEISSGKSHCDPTALAKALDGAGKYRYAVVRTPA